MKSYTNNAIRILSLGLCLGVAACGNKSADDVSKQVSNNANAKGNSAVQTASYASDCTSGKVDFAGVRFPGAQTRYDLSDLNFTKKETYFSDDCKTAAILVQEKGIVDVKARSGSVPGALEEDFHFQHTTVTLSSDAVVTAFNLAKICGFNNWAINAERDVSAQAAGALCPGKPSPRTSADLVIVENNVMYMGANTNQDANAPRPTALDRSLPFRKQ